MLPNSDERSNVSEDVRYYMVSIKLPQHLNEEFLSLIPQQRAHVNTLLSRGVICSYGLANDRSRLWTVLLAASVTEVHEIIDAFPLRKFMSFEISELAFHDSAAMKFPHLSLN